MNILIANTQELNPMIGGVERISDTYARQLQERGHKVWFVACLRSPYSKEYTPAAPQCILPNEDYDTPENVGCLRSFILDNQIEIIHNQAGNIPGFTKLCSRVAQSVRIPLVSAVHVDPLYQLHELQDFQFSRVFRKENGKAFIRMCLYPFRVGKVKRYIKETLGQIMKDSTVSVVLSQSYIKNMTDIESLADVVAIPNWMPFDHVENNTEKENVVLFVGRLDHEHKRPDRVIDAWKALAKDFPDWRLRIAGDGPNGEELRRYVERHRVPRVEFLGFCDPKEEYKKAKIMCQTSTIEGLSMVLLEGMAYGCTPVVYDSYAALYDVIKDGKSGMIIKAFNRRAYIGALRKLMTDAQLCKQMGMQATGIGQQFQKDKIVDTWLQLYSRCLEEVH